MESKSSENGKINNIKNIQKLKIVHIWCVHGSEFNYIEYLKVTNDTMHVLVGETPSFQFYTVTLKKLYDQESDLHITKFINEKKNTLKLSQIDEKTDSNAQNNSTNIDYEKLTLRFNNKKLESHIENPFHNEVVFKKSLDFLKNSNDVSSQSQTELFERLAFNYIWFHNKFKKERHDLTSKVENYNGDKPSYIEKPEGEKTQT